MPPANDNTRISQRTHAYTRLREALETGRIAQGLRLREAEWSHRLKVNRSALREAFGRLHSEGLIVEGVKGGYFVAHLAPDEVKDVLEVCAALELAAIERICHLGWNTRKNLNPLADACDELEWLLSKGYSFELNESERRFHTALVAAAGNERLTAIHHSLLRLPVLTLDDWDGQQWISSSRAMLSEHRDIIAAIREDDATQTQALLRNHWSGKIPSDLADMALIPRVHAEAVAT